MRRWRGLEKSDSEIRRRRLRWFAPVRRREVGACLGDVQCMEVAAARPRGRKCERRFKNAVLEGGGCRG